MSGEPCFYGYLTTHLHLISLFSSFHHSLLEKGAMLKVRCLKKNPVKSISPKNSCCTKLGCSSSSYLEFVEFCVACSSTFQNGKREKATVMYNTSLGVIFGVKKYADELWKICRERGIQVNLRTNLVGVRPEEKIAVFQNLDHPEKPPTEIQVR